MFDPGIYTARRKVLKNKLKSGLLLFLGNNESPSNYADNPYRFRQDSTFLYYFGLDDPGLGAIIDLDNDIETIFGYDFTVDDIVWMGPQPSLQERAERAGVKKSATTAELATVMSSALDKGQSIDILPPYRAEHRIRCASLLHVNVDAVDQHVSESFIKAVVDQRNVKASEEVAEIEKAVNITGDMHIFAMQHAKPGMVEREISGKMEGIAAAYGTSTSFPIIFSKHGETLHNHFHGHVLHAGDLVVNDSGAESLLHYAGDITRTIPIGGKFSSKQRDVYEIVLSAQVNAINAIRPGVPYLDIHLHAAGDMAEGLKHLGLMKGDVHDAVVHGAHALFFPHGLGHMMGLDVHDMENLGENYVGYDKMVQRSSQFGLKSLRLGRTLQPGFVLTVEPGLYFIPALIQQWKRDEKFTEYINYDKVEEYLDFGGIRIEDDVLVTESGNRVLGEPIPKTVQEVEALALA